MQKIKLTLIMLAVLLCSGCATQKSWVYSPNSYEGTRTSKEKTAVILPFKDGRANINSNKILLYLIPLFPFGSADYDIPEGAQMHVNSGLWTNYKPTEDFSKALSEELSNAKLFKEAYFDYKKGTGDIIISGTIISTRYIGKIISYGLSVYGPLLWFFGLPASSVNNDLSIELSCIDAKTDKLLFTKTYTANPYSSIGWIYSLPSDFNYPIMLKNIYRQFVEDIKNIPEL